MSLLPSSYSVEVVYTAPPGKYTFEHHHIGSPLPVFLRDGTAHNICICLVRTIMTAYGRHARFESVGRGVDASIVS